MKNIQISLLALILASSSCTDDILDLKDPNRLTPDNFYQTKEDAYAAVAAAYSPLQKSGLYGRNVQYVCGWRSDEAQSTSETVKMEENGVAVALFTNNASDAMAAQMWRDMYNGVFRANMVLDKIPSIDMEESLKNRMMGEAYFLRGLYYFHLVMFFGEQIPLHIAPPQSLEENNRAPAPDGAIWKQVIDDFAQAQVLLNSYTNTSSDYEPGRATLGAATGFLAKALLFRAQMKGNPNDYATATAEFKKIIDGQVGTYSLMHNYRDNFTNEKEYNAESLFEVGFAYNTNMDPVGEWIIDQDNIGLLKPPLGLLAQGSIPVRGRGGGTKLPPPPCKATMRCVPTPSLTRDTI